MMRLAKQAWKQNEGKVGAVSPPAFLFSTSFAFHVAQQQTEYDR
jgi:hypothetical protein